MSVNKEEPTEKKIETEVEDELAPISSSAIISHAEKTPEKKQKVSLNRKSKTIIEEEKVEVDEVLEEMDAEEHSLMDSFLDKITGITTGDVLKAVIVDIQKDYILVDIGSKAEGVLDPKELRKPDGSLKAKIGDKVKVMVRGSDKESGAIFVSKRFADQITAWDDIQKAYDEQTPIPVVVTSVVKSGLVADFGVSCFIPASQIDTKRVNRLEDYLGKSLDVLVIELDKEKRKVVLSSRKIIEAQELKNREKALSTLKLDSIITAKVKKISDFGVFVDLGGIDGLIPKQEVAWDKNPFISNYVKVDEDIKVKVIGIDKEKERITLSKRQAEPNPWDTVEQTYPQGTKVEGVVESIAQFGAFVKIQEGITGLIHVSDLSWTAKNLKASDIFKVGQTVEAIVINVSKEAQKISLGLKQLLSDPWKDVEDRYKVGERVKAKVSSIAKFGAFVNLEEHIEGLIHISDLSWDKSVKNPASIVNVGDEIDVIILGVDKDNRKISLGYKQMAESPFEKFVVSHRKGQSITGTITSLPDFGAFVKLADGIEGLIPVSMIDDKRIEKSSDFFKIGDEVTAKIVEIDTKKQNIKLSRKDYLEDVERNEVDQFSGKDTMGGMNLGELLKKVDLGVSE